jgi:hypothetical protein
VKRINVGAEFDWRVVEVTPQPHAAARVASDEAPIGYLGHRGHLLVPVAVAKDELDWHAGLVGAPQPHPSIAAAGDDAIVEQNGNRRHCAVLAAELGWNAGLVSAPPAARGRARFL